MRDSVRAIKQRYGIDLDYRDWQAFAADAKTRALIARAKTMACFHIESPLFQQCLGLPVYQEHVNLMAMELAGFTGAEADQLCKALAGKKSKKKNYDRQRRADGILDIRRRK